MARVLIRLFSLCSRNLNVPASLSSWHTAKPVRSIFAFTNNMSSVALPDAAGSQVKLKLDETDLAENGGLTQMKTETVSLTNLESKPAETDHVVSETLKTEESATAAKRVRLRKVILLLSYCGQGYFGMQKNPDTKTIENDLLQALLKCNYIDDEMIKRPQLIYFQRAARTDKSVSAARQIVSLKLPDNLEISKVNEHLPPAIRLMGMKRVTKNFDAKNNCDARTYSYMIPTFAFAPLQEITTEDYRITPEVIEELRKTLKLFVGTKNYHNFTSRKRANDPSALRFIMDFTCTDAFIQDGLEYVILQVKGQSFMMHQIRKMIGLAIAMLRGFASGETMEKAWELERIDIPRAPGVGLMLEQVHYERYDKKFGKDGVHETLTWEPLEKEIAEFCKTHIYNVVTKTENEEKSMLNWLTTLPFHTFGVRDTHLHEEGGYSQIGKAYLNVARDKRASFDDDDDDEEGGDDDEDERKPSSAKRQKLDD